MDKYRLIVFSLLLFSFYGCSHIFDSNNLDFPVITPSREDQATNTNGKLLVVPKYSINTKGVVYDLAWSPDGSILASSGYGRVNLWDGKSGFLVDSLIVGEGTIWDLEWTEDGKKLAILGDSNSTSIWEIETGDFFKLPVQLTIKSASWSPDGSKIAVGLCVQRFEVYDLESKSLIISGPTIHGVWGIDWSPDGQMIASAEFDGYIKIWDAITGDLIQTYHSGWMGTNAYAVDWSPNGRFLASGHRDGRVRIWALDDEGDEPYQILEKQRGWVSTVVWSPDGSLLVSTNGFGEADNYFIDFDNDEGSEGEAYLWDMVNGTLLTVVEESLVPIWSGAWSPDGRYIALGRGLIGGTESDTQINVWEVQD